MSYVVVINSLLILLDVFLSQVDIFRKGLAKRI